MGALCCKQQKLTHWFELQDKKGQMVFRSKWYKNGWIAYDKGCKFQEKHPHLSSYTLKLMPEC
jgi:hypothetical protein